MRQFLPIIFLIHVFSIIKMEAQTLDCEQQVITAKILLNGSDTVIKNEIQALKLLMACAKNENSEAQYLLGMVYKNGINAPINENLAFNYIKAAAEQNHPEAACELGVLYKNGIGCKLDFNTATSWFKKASELGSNKGAYSIGYLYLKGLGTIEQNYDEAIKWFTKSDYPMAQHWLGICNYFGYGLPVDKDRALELLLENSTYINNSSVLAEHLENNPDLLSLGEQKENTYKATEFSVKKINEVTSESLDQNQQKNIEVSKESLIGDWKGKLIELDWSGQKINRSFPFNLSFQKNNDTDDLNYSVEVNTTKKSDDGIFLDNSYYFNDLNIQLPRLYQDNTIKFDLDYNTLSLNSIEIKKSDHVKYLIANVETSISDWKEPGPPMLLVLGNTKNFTDNGQEIDDNVINALAQLKDENSFIKTYPNPFKNDLLIQYELLNDNLTNVEIYNFSNGVSETIVDNQYQKAGKHLYHVDGTNYSTQGFYVIRVITNDVVHTKLIIKE